MHVQEAGQASVITLESIAEILLALANVVGGDFGTRLDVTLLPPESPICILYVGINDMIRSLQVEQERGASYEAELEEKLHTIDVQRAAIKELSTPIIEVWEGVVCLPVVGVIDSVRSAEMTEALLGAVVARRARIAIIDLTAVQVIDTAAADHFLRMAKSVRLLGAQCVLTGISPSIAQTIVHMGVDLGDIRTYRTLRSALGALDVGREDDLTAVRRSRDA